MRRSESDAAYDLGCRLRSEAGAVSSEYAVLVGLIAVVIIGGVWLLGVNVAGLFDPLLGGFLSGG